MKNKIAIIGLLLMFIGSSALFAQNQNGLDQDQREQRKARMREMKRNFIKSELELTEKEELLFWPIYDKYEQKRQEIRKEHRLDRQKYRGKSPNDLTDQEADDLITNEMNFRQKRLDLDKEFQNELRDVLPVKKILMLHKAERKFKKQLLDRMKGRRGQNNQNGPRRRSGM